jgi:iron(III) transport system substrate-binding protein
MVAVVAALLTAGLCAAVAAEPLSDERIAAAKAEGKLVWYSSIISAPETREVIKLFEARYGIKVDLLESLPPATAERIRTEVAVGRRIGDITMTGTTAMYQLKQAGALQPHGEIPNLARLVIKPNVPEEVPAYAFTFSILINTDMVPPDQEPKSWRDLLDPKWKGKILSADLSAPGAGTTFYDVMKRAYGIEYHQALAKQDIVISQDLRQNQRRVAQGEFAIYLNEIVSSSNRPAGLPYKMIVPEEGVYYTAVTLAVIKGAPHPAAADLFLNFMLEPEAQLVYARAGMPVAVEGLQEQTPPDRRWSVFAKLMGQQNLEGQDERAREAKKIYSGAAQ